MSPELLLLVIFVSFLVGSISVLGGTAILLVVNRFSSMAKYKLDVPIPQPIIFFSNIVGIFGIIFGLFFYFRIGFILDTGVDFAQPDWFLVDILTGLFITTVSVLLGNIFRHHLSLNDDDEDKK